MHCTRLYGWDVLDSKSPLASDLARTLGAMIDVRAFPDGQIYLRAVKDREETLRADLQARMKERQLMPAVAGKLFGKLMFLSSQSYCRCGRSLLSFCKSSARA